MVVYYVLAMCLFFGQGYEEVARLLTDGLAYARRWRGTWRVPTTAAITRARARLGPEPLRALFAEVCQPVATEASDWVVLPGLAAGGGGWHHVRPAGHRGQCWFLWRGRARRGVRARAPSRRSGSPGWENAARMRSSLRRWGQLAVHETELARRLFGRLRAGMLLIADRGFTGFGLWRAAAATGADLLWRVRNDAPYCRWRSSWAMAPISAISTPPATSTGTSARSRCGWSEYTLAGQATVYRLITTILDPAQAPALDLAAAVCPAMGV